ncbi:MAG: type II secretion system protein GspG [Massilia sp.]
MAALNNSQRRVPKATYVPVTLPATAQAKSGRVVEKVAYLRSLNIAPSEFDALAALPELAALKVPSTRGRNPDSAAVDVVRDFISTPAAVALKRYGPAIAQMSMADLTTLGGGVARVRRAAAVAVRNISLTRGEGPAPTKALHPMRILELARIDTATSLVPAHGAAESSVDIGALAGQLEALADDADQVTQQFQYHTPISPVGWIHLERLEMTPVGVEHGELVHTVPLTPGETVNIAHREWSVTTQTFETLATDALEGFSSTGIAEKTDLAQSTSVEAKHSSSLDVGGSVSASYNGGAYSLTASASVDFQTKAESDESDKRSIAHSMAVTRSASTRTMKEHKTSFVVSSVAGAENLAVQVLTNSSKNEAMRVDYYQLLRRWRVDLIRYGLRMTYDLVVPNPGLGLVSKLIELAALAGALLKGNTFSLDPGSITTTTWTQLEKDVGASVDPPPAAEVQLTQVATVPEQTYDKWGSSTLTFDVPEGYAITKAHFRGFFALYDYKSDGRHLQVRVFGEPKGTTNTPTGEFEGANAPLEFDLTSSTLIGRTGSAFLVVDYHNIDFGEMQVRITMEPTTEALHKWRSKVWDQLREADQANFNARLTLMRDRKAQLEAEIAAFDALTLRKMEHEEVMRSVLQWLLGPDFALMPDAVRTAITKHVNDTGAISGSFAFPEVHNLPVGDYLAFSEHGELIKFLHNAIEWENMIFFVYPYFWDRLDNWEFKKFLMHPDYTHRAFLRAGYARVVIPVRPGFEVSFAMLMETGDATAPLDSSYPYVSIGEETRNFAMTNYEGIPPANPDHNVRTLLYPLQRRAWNEIQQIMAALDQYHADNGLKYPATLADPALALAATKAGASIPTKDPWGTPYHYQMPGVHGEYDLLSHGDPNQPTADGMDADITSYAEGSVVGRWYEYTPTSGLDVAITMIAIDQTPLATKPSPA